LSLFLRGKGDGAPLFFLEVCSRKLRSPTFVTAVSIRGVFALSFDEGRPANFGVYRVCFALPSGMAGPPAGLGPATFVPFPFGHQGGEMCVSVDCERGFFALRLGAELSWTPGWKGVLCPYGFPCQARRLSTLGLGSGDYDFEGQWG